MHECGHVIDQSSKGTGFESSNDFNENSEKNPYDNAFRKYEKFNETLKACREEKNLSIKSLADIIGVKPYTISDWETGRSEPSINNLIKLSNFFNVRLDFLVGNTLPQDDEYDEIINIINNFQTRVYDDEINELFSGLSNKNRKKLINILTIVKQELLKK